MTGIAQRVIWNIPVNKSHRTNDNIATNSQRITYNAAVSTKYDVVTDSDFSIGMRFNAYRGVLTNMKILPYHAALIYHYSLMMRESNSRTYLCTQFYLSTMLTGKV